MPPLRQKDVPMPRTHRERHQRLTEILGATDTMRTSHPPRDEVRHRERGAAPHLPCQSNRAGAGTQTGRCPARNTMFSEPLGQDLGEPGVKITASKLCNTKSAGAVGMVNANAACPPARLPQSVDGISAVACRFRINKGVEAERPPAGVSR